MTGERNDKERMKPVPKEIRCQWTAREGERGTYDCPQCGSWTANLPLYKNAVCDRKERRRANGAGRRHNDVIRT